MYISPQPDFVCDKRIFFAGFPKLGLDVIAPYKEHGTNRLMETFTVYFQASRTTDLESAALFRAEIQEISRTSIGLATLG
jgi:hypothetical protein